MKLFNEILYLGAISSILIVLILITKKVFHKVLSPKWHYYIWMLLIVRLLVPFTPESSLSALNIIYYAADQISLPWNELGTLSPEYSDHETVSLGDIPEATVGDDNMAGSGSSDSLSDLNTYINNPTDPASYQNNHRKQISYLQIATYVWLAGMLILAIYTIYINILFAVRVKRNYHLLTDSRVNGILDECKRIMRIQRRISVYYSKMNRTPSLYSSLHTKILVSQKQIEQLSDQELKCIFLHELSHYKRKDIAVNWILTLIQIVYFFHPLLWYAFHRIHEDCEISCDAKALKYLREEEHLDYGSTVIKLIKLYSESKFIPATAGLWKHTSNYKRRIIMISKTKKSKWSNTLLTFVLILAIGLIGLTGCKKTILEDNDNSQINNETTVTDTPASEGNDSSANNGDSASENSNSENTDNTGTTDQINLDQLRGYLGLKKEELINQLGDKYEPVDEGGLEFGDLGIRVWFNDKGITNQVYTNASNIDFNGAKVGDAIDRFTDQFGAPMSDVNQNAVYQEEDYYLSVYYDAASSSTYAIYLLTDAPVTPAQEAVMPATDPTNSNTSTTEPSQGTENTQGNESFFGDWRINQVIAYGIGTYSKETAEGLIGKELSFTSDSATCFGDDPSYLDKTAKNPEYDSTVITSSDFTTDYRITFESLGITGDSVTLVTAADTEGNGCTFLVKDESTLILIGGGTYFELVRK